MLDGLKSIAEEVQEQTRSNTKGLILFFVSVVILGVVGFCEILYVAMLIPAFPDGLVRAVAITGACATGLSAVLLLAGKLHWFSKGRQAQAAWAFVGVETFILTVNVLLAVQLHDGHVADWLVWWEQAYPAAPIAAFVGWGLILFFDKDNEMRAVRRENKERQEKKELDYENLVHHTTLAVKHESLQILTAKLRAKIATAQYQQGLDVVADQIANGVLGQMSGSHITSLLPPAVPQQARDPFAPICDSCGQGGPGAFKGSIWFCNDCLQKREANLAKPWMTSDDFVRLFEQYQEKERLYQLYEQSGKDDSFSAFVKKQQSPLSSPQLDNQDSQSGSNNGKSH